MHVFSSLLSVYRGNFIVNCCIYRNFQVNKVIGHLWVFYQHCWLKIIRYDWGFEVHEIMYLYSIFHLQGVFSYCFTLGKKKKLLLHTHFSLKQEKLYNVLRFLFKIWNVLQLVIIIMYLQTLNVIDIFTWATLELCP